MIVRHAWLMPLVLVLGLAGCSKSEPAKTGAAVVNPKSAQECVQFFLDAVRKGDDKTAGAMLTTLARTKTQEMNLQVAPPGSNTATFEVGEVKLVGENGEEGAYVASKWTDVGDDGKPHTDEIMWMVSKDSEGWRIVGMGVKVFEDLEPVYLNFEDPADMLTKQQMVEQEMARRTGTLPAGQGTPGNPPPSTDPAATGAVIAGNGQPAGPGTPPTQAQLPPAGVQSQLK